MRPTVHWQTPGCPAGSDPAQPTLTPIAAPIAKVAPAAIAPNSSCRSPAYHHGRGVKADDSAPAAIRPRPPQKSAAQSSGKPNRYGSSGSSAPSENVSSDETAAV